MSDLIEIKDLKPEEVFTIVGIAPIIETVKMKVKDFVPDMTTKQGREEIASMAYKVARSKTLIDDLGKEFVSGIKEKAKVVDAARKKSWDELEKLQKDLRQPLTEYEQKEERRIQGHKIRLEKLQSYLSFNPENIQQAKFAIENIQLVVDSGPLEEFETSYLKSREEAFVCLNKKLQVLIESENNKLELERLKKKNQELERAEHERKIAEEAALKAQEQAEDKAKQEKLAYEKEMQAQLQKAEFEKKKAEQEKIDAQNRLIAEEFNQKEKERIFKEAQDKKLAEEKKISEDMEHRKKCNQEALTDICEHAGIGQDGAKKLIIAIVQCKIRHINLKY